MPHFGDVQWRFLIFAPAPNNSRHMHKSTKAIRSQTPRSPFREHSTPLFLTSSFVFESAEQGRALFDETEEGNIYSRFSNPTVQEFTDKMAMLENHDEGLAFATGMAAVFAGFAGLLRSGDHIVSSRALFGSAHQIITQILAGWGIGHTYVDASATEAQWRAALRPETKMIYLETPSNPGLELVDMEMIGRISAEHGLLFYVDNCFATPILQNPADYGAQLVAHSATKFIDGQGRVLGGVLTGTAEVMDRIRFFARHTGPSLSPFNAWVLSKSLETLDVRMERHCSNALALARTLTECEGVKKVNYPWLETHPQFDLAKRQMRAGGAIVTIELAGGFEHASRLMQSLQLVSLSSNLGDTRSIITHPHSTTHSKLSAQDKAALGITEGLLRISVGLEHIEDLQEDFRKALEISYPRR